MGLLDKNSKSGSFIRDGHSSVLAKMFGGRKKTAEGAKSDKGNVSKYFNAALPKPYGGQLSKEYGTTVGENQAGTSQEKAKLPKVKVKTVPVGKMASVRTAKVTAVEMEGKKEDMVKFCEHCGSRLKRAYNPNQPKSVEEAKNQKLQKEKVDFMKPGEIKKISKKIILPFTKRIAKKMHNIGCGLYRKNHSDGTVAIWEKFDDDDGISYIVKKSIEKE